MTRADKIKEYVKERYGVELSDQIIRETVFTFRGCDGFECPEDCIHDEEARDCDKCKYNEFWEQEDKPRYTNKTKEEILRKREELRNRGGLKDVLPNS